MKTTRKALESTSNKGLLAILRKLAKELDAEFDANEEIISVSKEKQFYDICKIIESRGFKVDTHKAVQTKIRVTKNSTCNNQGICNRHVACDSCSLSTHS